MEFDWRTVEYKWRIIFEFPKVRISYFMYIRAHNWNQSNREPDQSSPHPPILFSILPPTLHSSNCSFTFRLQTKIVD
jgi:hypothetical protein